MITALEKILFFEKITLVYFPLASTIRALDVAPKWET
jgi:hypothetical protein